MLDNMCLMQPEGGGIIIMCGTHLDVESSLKQGLWLFFLNVPQGLWDLSSLTRDQTQAPGCESAES